MQGTAYYCYTSPEELDAIREAQRARGEKPRYDGRWRPDHGKVLPEPPAGVAPVVRFKNPTMGMVGWKDLVKGYIGFNNNELDDLVIARADGTPTYNFCVVVDDWDMGITHVIRGDDHVNNTPRQINILKALGATVPQYAHLSMILGDDGTKLSKRHGAVSVMQYDEDGYLPEAVVNYLARLGWSHGDKEIFSVEEFCSWFDLDHITPSAAQFNTEKLNWVNQHYLKQADNARLAKLVRPRLEARGVKVGDVPVLESIVSLYKERVATLNELADAAEVFYIELHPAQELLDEHLMPEVLPALRDLAARFAEVAWERSCAGRIDQGDAGQAQPENAQAGDAVARDAGGSNAHSVGRCRGGFVPPRDRAGADEAIPLNYLVCRLYKHRSHHYNAPSFEVPGV